MIKAKRAKPRTPALQPPYQQCSPTLDLVEGKLEYYQPADFFNRGTLQHQRKRSKGKENSQEKFTNDSFQRLLRFCEYEIRYVGRQSVSPSVPTKQSIKWNQNSEIWINRLSKRKRKFLDERVQTGTQKKNAILTPEQGRRSGGEGFDVDSAGRLRRTHATAPAIAF